MIGAIEAVEVLMGYHQSQMTRQVVFIPADLVPPHQRMLKSKAEREPLEEDSEDIYPATRFETYNPLHTQNSFSGGEELHQLNTRKL